MQGPYLRKYGVEAKINFVLYEVDGVDFRTDAADAGSDCSIMKDEGNEATCTNDFVDEGKGYSLVLTATELTAARVVVYVVDSATKAWLDDAIVVETYGHASAMHLNFPSDLTHIMGTILTEGGAGRLAAALIKFLDVATPAKDINDIGAASGGGSNLVIPAGYVGDFKDDATIEFGWNTIDRSGAAVAPSTAGTVKVYKSTGTTEVQAPTGVTDTRAFSGTTGSQQCVIDLSASSEYTKGSNYMVVLEGAVVDTKTVNVCIGTFSIEKRFQGAEFEKEG